ncbi:hypothetical protein ACFV2Q_28545, partial [Streptomyces sp. NPDC059650]
ATAHLGPVAAPLLRGPASRRGRPAVAASAPRLPPRPYHRLAGAAALCPLLPSGVASGWLGLGYGVWGGAPGRLPLAGWPPAGLPLRGAFPHPAPSRNRAPPGPAPDSVRAPGGSAPEPPRLKRRRG